MSSGRGGATKATRLPPEVNRILFVRNLPYKISAEDMYDLFGKYGAIRQIRMYGGRRYATKDLTIITTIIYCRGTSKETRGTAFVVYEDIFDAKNACEHLSGFNLLGRYLIVLYWQSAKATGRKTAAAAAVSSTERVRKEMELLKAQYNM